MIKTISTVFLITIITLTAISQNIEVIIGNEINLPKDTILKKLLLSNLNGFLLQKELANHENTFVLKAHLLETSILLDEMKEIENNKTIKNDTFYKPYLTNILRLNDSTYKIQLAYTGINNSVASLHAHFTIMAKKCTDKFYFYSPLTHNTTTWKSYQIANTKIYFKKNLNKNKANKFVKLSNKFDTKLNLPINTTEFYCCDNFNEALQLVGVDYKLVYNGKTYNTFSAFENKTNLVMNGTLTASFKVFDPHDLWHNRLHKKIPITIINKPVDEGTAYLYGGSWGLSWKQILKRFKTFAKANKNADWLTLYNESKNFDEKAKYPLNVDMVINALIIKRLEKEKGFEAVIELLSCGKQEKENSNYFKALEKITGITKNNFNASIWELIKVN